MSKAQEDITEDEKDFLARVRDPSDRKEISYTRLVRTFYGGGSEINLSELILEAEYDGTIFDDIALYDVGSDDGLQSLHGILTRIPQIVEGTTVFARRRDNRMREALEKAIDKDGDEIDFEMAHQAARWTHVLIYDKEANDGPGNLLVVYIDDRGRALRYSRLEGTEDLWAADGMFLSGQDCCA